MKSKSKDVVDQFVNRVLIEGKVNEIANYVDPSVISITCGGIRGKGIDETTKSLGAWSKAFKILENQCLCSLSDESHVIEQWKVKAIHIGEFLNVKPSNAEVNFSGVSIYEIRKGKIVGITGYSDFLIATKNT